MCCSQHRDISFSYGCDENFKVRKARAVFFLQLFLLAVVLLVNIKARFCKKFITSGTLFFSLSAWCCTCYAANTRCLQMTSLARHCCLVLQLFTCSWTNERRGNWEYPWRLLFFLLSVPKESGSQSGSTAAFVVLHKTKKLECFCFHIALTVHRNW